MRLSIKKLNSKLRFTKGRINKATAMRIAQEALDRGIVFTDESRPFCEYVRSIWDYDSSPYILRRLKENSNAISRKYAKDTLSAFNLHAVPVIGESCRLSEFTPSIAEEIKDRMLLGGKSSTTINKVMQAIRTALSEAYRKGYIKDNYADRIVNVLANNKERGIPSDEEVASLLSFLNSSNKKGTYERAYYLITALAIYSGMRLGEIIALHPDAITILDEETSTIDVRYAYNPEDGLKCPKGKKARTVTVPSVLAKEILHYSESSPIEGGYIFWSLRRVSNPMSENTVSKEFKKALREIGISYKDQEDRSLSFHSLRHYYNTAMGGVIAGDELRRIVGHSSIKMTDNYTHETDRHLQEINKKREKVIPASLLLGNIEM